ncbi:MAG: hypothetical protein RL605_449 [Actinomycetota bacterium]|jgi:N-acetyl-1-D-myo-inositol-2-amino-2-deoxy-alpha-D-glucopyranoside deacetylase
MAKATLNAKRILLVHAHPDDESLFTGHLIAERLAAGAEVLVLTLTRGERGRVKLDEIKSLEGRLESMGHFRSNELLNALKEYGPGVKHKFAGTRAYLDSGMRVNLFGRAAKPRDLDEMSLTAAGSQVIADDILAELKSFKPDAVVTYNAKGGYGHPDHVVAHRATASALRQYARARRGRAPQFWVIAEPGERAEVSVGNAETAKIKRAALEAHASQVSISGEGYSLVEGKETRFDAPERFRRTNPNPLVMLSPLVTIFWAIPLGVLMGLAGTLMHQVRAQNSEHTPIGLIVALISVGALALALRLLRSSRGALYLTSITFGITVFTLAQRQAGGEVLIPSNDVGTIWAYGSIILCAVIILFPQIRPAIWRKSASGHQ